MIKYGRQFINRDDKKAVLSVLSSDWLTQGPKINEFENSLRKFFGAKHCCVVSSGTAALHLTGLALGWKPGDVVLSSPISFLASSNSIIYSGATPDFVDIDAKTYNIDPDKLEGKIKSYLKKKRKIKAIIATDFAGNPCDWKMLKKISNTYNVRLINDNCHAIGATYQNDKFYATKYADVVTHSYHPVKNITTGEGGAILTNNKRIYDRVKILRSHGIIKQFKKKDFNQGPWFYEMHELGYNYRISDIHCALGISQIKRLRKFVKKREKIAHIYDLNFKSNNNFVIPQVKKNCGHAYHLYPLQINFNKNKQKKKLFRVLNKKNINLQVHYIPIHLQPFYKKRYGFKKGDFPIAEKFYEKEVSLPIYFSLKTNEIYKVIKNIKSFLIKE